MALSTSLVKSRSALMIAPSDMLGSAAQVCRVSRDEDICQREVRGEGYGGCCVVDYRWLKLFREGDMKVTRHAGRAVVHSPQPEDQPPQRQSLNQHQHGEVIASTPTRNL